MTYAIALPCADVKDRACIDECPVDCIYEGERSLYIHPDECVDCGACEPVCPVEAIYYEDDLPDEWSDYYKANVEFFDNLVLPVEPRRSDRRASTIPSSPHCPSNMSSPSEKDNSIDSRRYNAQSLTSTPGGIG